MRTGRPHKIKEDAEWELYFLRTVSRFRLKTCADMCGVSVATAKRILAKYRRLYGERAEPMAREFRAKMFSLRDST